MLALLRKDMHTLNWKRSLTMQLLMLGIFLVFAIGQLGELEQRLGLAIDGMGPLLDKINETGSHRLMFTNTLIAVGFHVSALVFSLYVGIPHVLQFFTKEKAEKNLSFMLAVVSRPCKIMISVWLFALLRVIAMAIINGALIWIGFSVLGFRSVWSSSLLSSSVTIVLVIAAFLYVANAIVWATNGSELVLKIFRMLILVGIVAAFPAVNYLQMDFSFLDLRYAVASAVLGVIAVVVSHFLMKLFRVEKVV
ncbi:hypothetical protein GCM10010912_54460 [Paenibacillus albidus]|uniref:Uncharacterized protein n=1 Tax=Paenibacillus albidus TaxID=2041023 RepID=A0A917CZ46_9BACL|nr:hypothetical protein [Paenibacillus albidus]GGG02814.1 hypothetical protein GCM10010912_54460 [Paenibacillus albidus]